jgi:hypothetical protein
LFWRILLRCCQPQAAALAKKAMREEAADKDNQSPEAYEEACRLEEEKNSTLIAMGTPATPNLPYVET